MPLAALIDVYFLVVIVIVRVVSWFPYRPVRIAVAGTLAGLSWHLSRSKRAKMTRAVSRAFGGQLDSRGLARIIKGSLFDSWLEILGSIPNRIDAEATRSAQIIGWERLERALAAGKGVILWENGGLGRRFWIKQILSRKGLRVYQIHGTNHVGCLDVDRTTMTWFRQKVIRPFFDDAERPYLEDIIILPADGDLAYGRTLMRRLRENALLCLAADGEYGAKFLSVPMLGTRCQFSSGMVSLARLSGAAIIPVVCWQTEDGRARLVIEEPIHVSQDADRERQTEQILPHYAALVERDVRHNPASYRNWHTLPGAMGELPAE